MKHRELIDHLRKEGRILYREGTKHSVVLNPENGRMATAPRHCEIEILLPERYIASWISPSLRYEFNVFLPIKSVTFAAIQDGKNSIFSVIDL